MIETDDWGIPVSEKPLVSRPQKKARVDESSNPDKLWESVEAIDVRMSKLEDVVRDRVCVSVESFHSGTASLIVTVDAGDLSRVVRSLAGSPDIDAELANVFGDTWCMGIEESLHKSLSGVFGRLVSGVAVECRTKPVKPKDFDNAYFEIRVVITFAPQSIQSEVKSVVKEVIGKLI